MDSPGENNGDWIEPGVTSCDVVVVGAGLAGLTAARELKSRSPNLKVVVLEAKDRVGGRTYTVNLKAANGKTDRWDLGGQWFGNSQKYALNLAREFGLETYPQYRQGKAWIQSGKAATRPISNIDNPSFADFNKFSLFEGVDYLRALQQLENLVKTVDVEDIYATPNAKEFDALSADEWIKRNCWTRTVQDAMEVATKSIYGIPSKRLSFLYFLYYAKCAGSFENLIGIEKDGGQGIKVKGGMEQMSKRLATVLSSDELYLNTAVTVVDMNDPQNVLIQTMDTSQMNNGMSTPNNEKLRFKCKRVIVAAPPNQCGHIRWLPGLPYLKQQLFEGMPCGNLFKCIVTYERAFWREKGFSGEIVSAGLTEFPGETLPIISGFDASTVDGNPAIVLFLNNEWADRKPEERRSAVLRDLARFFGDEALDCVDYADKDWHLEPFSGGCPVACLPPGNMEALSHVREPVNLVHFAGTETSTHWPGYMSGAIQSGYRAAHEVLFHLDPSQVEHRHLKSSVYDTDCGFPQPPDNSYTQQFIGSPWPRRIILYSAVALGIYLYSRKYQLSHTARVFRPLERGMVKWWSGYNWP